MNMYNKILSEEKRNLSHQGKRATDTYYFRNMGEVSRRDVWTASLGARTYPPNTLCSSYGKIHKTVSGHRIHKHETHTTKHYINVDGCMHTWCYEANVFHLPATAPDTYPATRPLGTPVAVLYQQQHTDLVYETQEHMLPR